MKKRLAVLLALILLASFVFLSCQSPAGVGDSSIEDASESAHTSEEETDSVQEGGEDSDSSEEQSSTEKGAGPLLSKQQIRKVPKPKQSSTESISDSLEEEGEPFIFAGSEWDNNIYGDMTGFKRSQAEYYVEKYGKNTLFFVWIYTYDDLFPQIESEDFYRTIYSILKEEGCDVKLFNGTELFGYLTIEQIDRIHFLINDVPESMKEMADYIFGIYWAQLALNDIYSWRKPSVPSFYSYNSGDTGEYREDQKYLYDDKKLRDLAWDAATELFWGKKFKQDGNIWQASSNGENGQLITEQITIEDHMLHYTSSDGTNTDVFQLISAFDPPGVKLSQMSHLNELDTSLPSWNFRAVQIIGSRYLTDDFGITVDKKENGELVLICRYYDPKPENKEIKTYSQITYGTEGSVDLSTDILPEIQSQYGPERMKYACSALKKEYDPETGVKYASTFLIPYKEEDGKAVWYRVHPLTREIDKLEYDEDSLYYTFRKRLWGIDS